MARARWLLLTFVLPLVWVVFVYWGTRPDPPVYTLPGRIVMDVTATGGSGALHTVEPIYPPGALRNKVEGTVKLKVTIAADGTVSAAIPVAGPAIFRDAAIASVRQWQYAAGALESQAEVAFTLRNATTSFIPPRPIAPVSQHGPADGSVRVVVMIGPEGHVEFVQPVSGPPSLIPFAVEAVKQAKFSPALRNSEPATATAVIDIPFIGK